ncbi:MAG: hypothetical protein PHC34_01375 [Candidatus Gastranaerophilales bacterium]|nr:hypothetical protein [Candidatus Gastranaerophilales bacterium]
MVAPVNFLSASRTQQSQQINPVAYGGQAKPEASLFAKNITFGDNKIQGQPASDKFLFSSKTENSNLFSRQQVDLTKFVGTPVDESSKVNLVTRGMDHKSVAAVNQNAEQESKGVGLTAFNGQRYVSNFGKHGVAGGNAQFIA